MDMAEDGADDHEDERHEEEDGVGSQAGGVGLQQHCQGLLVGHVVDVALHEGVGVEDVGHEHADGDAEGQDVPCKAGLGGVEGAAG